MKKTLALMLLAPFAIQATCAWEDALKNLTSSSASFDTLAQHVVRPGVKAAAKDGASHLVHKNLPNKNLVSSQHLSLSTNDVAEWFAHALVHLADNRLEKGNVNREETIETFTACLLLSVYETIKNRALDATGLSVPSVQELVAERAGPYGAKAAEAAKDELNYQVARTIAHSLLSKRSAASTA